jgi:carbon monoxide dehydrogenase subunit G
MGLNFSGTISVVQQDRDQGEAHFRVEGSDRRVGGGFRAEMIVTLQPMGPGQSELTIATDTVFMGKLGELGQPVIRRKAVSTIEQFAKNLARRLNAATE